MKKTYRNPGQQKKNGTIPKKAKCATVESSHLSEWAYFIYRQYKKQKEAAKYRKMR